MIEIIIDGLSRSITNLHTGESFKTKILKATQSELKKIRELKGLNKWSFDWENETGEVYKLITIGNPDIIHGLISVEDHVDNIFIKLIEASPVNVGKNKIYQGIPANLFAYACYISYNKGYGGVVSMIAKNNLIEHYKNTLQAIQVGTSNLMFIDEIGADFLIKNYFSEKENE